MWKTHRPAVLGRLLSLAVVAALAGGGSAQAQARSVAVTFDDLPFVGVTPEALCDPETALQLTRDFVAMLEPLKAPSTAFVNAGKVCEAQRDTLVPRLLDVWLDAGHGLGNHTLSHPNPNRITAEAYLIDAEAGAPLLRQSLQARGDRLRWYRHPYLMTGDTAEKKSAISAGLAAQNYTIAPVTIDNADWMFAAVYARALRDGDTALQARIAVAYVDYLDGIFAYFEAYSTEVLGREPAQILLLHANFLNRDHFPAVHAMLVRRGYRIAPLDEVMRDPVYAREETYVGRAGISWLHRWADTDGLAIRWEPQVPGWIDAAYKAL